MVSELATFCKEFKLGSFEKLAARVIFENQTQHLTEVLKLLAKHRDAQRVQRLLAQAKFPVIKPFESYKFDHISWPNEYDKERLMSLDVIEKQNILCLSAVDTGKTHLATALGVNACSLGKKVRFFRVLDL